MPSLTVVKALLWELITLRRAARRAEPDLVMDEPDKVAAFVRAGREDGVMDPVYLFNAGHICDVVRDGDLVLDLGCGPATQLGLVAELKPKTRFIGIDLSQPMLKHAQAQMAEAKLDNVELRRDDLCALDSVPDGAADAVISTVALHHLPDRQALGRAFAAIARVLRPGGGVYLFDFGHLKSERAIECMAYQHASRQAELFTLDYLYSLRAAFSAEDFRQLTKRHLPGRARLHSMAFVPFMLAIKSAHRADVRADSLRVELQRREAKLSAIQRRDLRDLRAFFALGGLRGSMR